MTRYFGALTPVTSLLIDRDDERRSREQLFDELAADPTTRILVFHHGRVLMTDASHTALAQHEYGEITSAQLRVYLGRARLSTATEPLSPVIAAALSDAAAHERAVDAARWISPLIAQAQLTPVQRGLVLEALGILNWHESHAFCPHCGTPTVVEHGGWVRRCLSESREIFPRTDPAVIVRVLDGDDRILLGSNRAWEDNRWSLLAGFVEPGEQFEQAVIREVFEEAGVRVSSPRYLGSQPWPFPASVMIGMEAHTVEAQPNPRADGTEIVAVRWFSREDLWRERDEVLLPGSFSIAHAIISDWYGGSLDTAPDTVRKTPQAEPHQ